MFIIAGLGNPTLQYEGTRHNVGFDVIDMLADRYNISVDGRKGRALVGKGIIEGQKVLLVKPQTYMNLSGESLRELVNYYKIDEEHELPAGHGHLKVPRSRGTAPAAALARRHDCRVGLCRRAALSFSRRRRPL